MGFLQLPAWFQQWWPVAAFVGVLVLGLWLGLRLAHRRVARRVARHRKLGDRGEKRAAKLLSRAGYRVVERQPSGAIDVLVDDRPESYPLRADLLVEGHGGRWIAEVKGGLTSARVAHRATRRQLLEYACAFDVTGVLLVDAARDRVVRVRFPSRLR